MNRRTWWKRSRGLTLLGALAALVIGTAHAQAATPAAAGDAAIEQKISATFEQRMGRKPTSVARSPVGGLWEVVMGADVVYVDPEVTYLIDGQMFDARSRENLTEKRRNDLLRIDFKTLPLPQAVKLVRGNGARVVATFEDPNCSYCRKLHTELQSLKDATVYVFLYPILSPDSFEKAKDIWCAKDRAAAWNGHMLEGKAPAAAAADCKTPLQDNVALGRKLDVRGTPTMFFADGTRAPGALPLAQIEARMAEAAKKK